MIDFAIIILKSDLVLACAAELKTKGITHLLVISSGFSEAGDEGKRKQEELSAWCRENDIIMMGPNCLGFMNFSEKISVFSGRAVEGKLNPGPVGVFGQSGATTELIMTKILDKTPGVSFYATTGNEAMLSAEDCLEYLVEDGHTKIAAGFIEQFRDIGKLKRIAERAAEKRIPIVILKVGRSEKAQKAALSHTGALAGNDRIMQGFFYQSGIIRVESIDEMVDTVNLFSRCELPGGDGLGICSFSGGLCGLYADLCEASGIRLSRLSDITISRLKELLPDFAIPDNPLDVTGSGFLKGMAGIIRAMLDDEDVDILAPVCIPPRGPGDLFAPIINDSFIPFMKAGAKPITPIVFREISEYARNYFREKGFYFIERPDIGFKALGHFMRYAGYLRKRGYMDKG
jgi:acetate---CoA ligase (ADP-forming)